MEESAFLPLPQGMSIDQVHQSESQLTVVVISTSASAPCPGCGCFSDPVHSRYQRTVNDLPCAGRRVVLGLCVRKFFCLTLTCQRKVFAERLPTLVQPWARVINRLLEALKALGLAASAEVSERLAPRLGMMVKASTLLCYLYTIPPPSEMRVQKIGIDDFALRRGDCYDTILVNLETGKPLDLLPDRTSDAVFPWLVRHQEIDVISRDRANGYADAIKRALPHATQIADRFHLCQNLREHLQTLLDHVNRQIKIDNILFWTVKLGPTGPLKDNRNGALPHFKVPILDFGRPIILRNGVQTKNIMILVFTTQN